MPWLALSPADRPTDKAYVSRPAEFLRLQLRLRVAVFAATVAVAAVLALMGVWWWPAFFLALGLLFVLERLAGKGRNLDPEHLRRGIRGEEAVADVLAALPSSYWVLHGVWTGHGDVDHVVIGPTGVFALETKAWEGRFYRSRGHLHYNGKPAEHVLRQARGAAGQVRQLLLEAGIDEWVEAVVVAAAGLRLTLPHTLPAGQRRFDRGRRGLRHGPASLDPQLEAPGGGGDPGGAGRGGPLGRPWRNPLGTMTRRGGAAQRSRRHSHPTPFTRRHPHALTRGVRVLTVFAPPPLGGRGAGALVECGVHPDLDIALEGS